MSEETKVCTRCGAEKPLEGGFQRHRVTADGYANKCRVCIRELSEIGSEAKRAAEAEKSTPAPATAPKRPEGATNNQIERNESQPHVTGQQSVLLEVADGRRIADAWLPHELLKRAREFEGAGQLCRWGFETRWLNAVEEAVDKDLEIRWYGDENGKWLTINICGEASKGQKLQKVRQGRCNHVMYYSEDKRSWIVQPPLPKGTVFAS